MSAYRDDLEAAQLRGNDLEREVQQLRARNAQLEKQRAEEAQRLLDERKAPEVPTPSGNGRMIVLIGAWIAAVVCAVQLSAPWIAVLASVVFLVIMALTSSGGTGSEDSE